ncbi:TPA: phage regulatory CII family protein [Yersinia enterocolitica]|nr:phage regulatory CII family protein [Yersinia enterocolitica]EKN4025690.1 phage regulatory CII family protein [Yersinia enterocolitica]EKN5125911.1 hypothetical protein [Yersinia enterocolitica]ELI7981557.1 phage regulatory CII family protein [Yersinia enterocolitica]ELY5185983.1 phage regulatory CII family protein [Yersinia enterocolitica]
MKNSFPQKKATQIRRGAISAERLIPARKHSMIESVNSGIRMLSLSVMALQARLYRTIWCGAR